MNELGHLPVKLPTTPTSFLLHGRIMIGQPNRIYFISVVCKSLVDRLLTRNFIRSRFDIILNHNHLDSLGLIVIAELPVVAGLGAQ